MPTLKKYTDPRQWFRALLKTSVHAGTGAVLSVFTTNGAEHMAPEALRGIGLTAQQAFAVFAVSAFLAAIRFINQTTQEDSNQ